MPAEARIELTARALFEAYTAGLIVWVAERAGVVGLVLLGSTADTARVDEWSDHDFYLIVHPGRQEEFRTDLTWLPDTAGIAFAVRETEHVLKVVYDDGAVLEFAVASIDEASAFGGSPRRVALDRGGIAARMRAAPSVPAGVPDDLVDFRLFLSLILIGVGRACRGEELAGGQLVRTYAAERLMWLLRRYLPDDEVAGSAGADPFNPWRRFERAHPRLGAALAAAMAQLTEPCGLELLDIAEAQLAPRWPAYPGAELHVVRAALTPRGSNRNSQRGAPPGSSAGDDGVEEALRREGADGHPSRHRAGPGASR